MTNEPEPNTRAGESLPCPWCSGKAFAQSPSLGHSSWRVVCDDCCAEGPTVPSYNVEDPEAFCIIAWNNRAGNVALPTWDHYAEEHVNTRPLPQPSELVERLFAEIAHGDEAHREWLLNALKSSPALAQIAKLQADGDKLAGALETISGGWDFATLEGAQNIARQALTEWKDRA